MVVVPPFCVLKGLGLEPAFVIINGRGVGIFVAVGIGVFVNDAVGSEVKVFVGIAVSVALGGISVSV